MIRIIAELMNYLVNDKFAESFEHFSEKYCDVFDDQEENKLEYTPIYDKFRSLYERKLEGNYQIVDNDYDVNFHFVEFLREKGYSPEQFFKFCWDLQEKGRHDHEEFIQFILALADFDVFLVLMKDCARKKKTRNQ